MVTEIHEKGSIGLIQRLTKRQEHENRRMHRPKPNAFRWKTLRLCHKRDVLNHWMALSEKSRRARFAGTVTDSYLATNADSFFDRSGFAIGLFFERQLCALGEVRPSTGSERGVSELALSVLDSCQGQGAGRFSLTVLLSLALAKGFRRTEAWVCADNVPMRALCSSLSAKRSRVDGHFRYLFDLDAALNLG